MKKTTIFALLTACILWSACSSGRVAVGRGLPDATDGAAVFCALAEKADVYQRDSMAVRWYSDGEFPRFMRRFVRVDTRIVTSAGQKAFAFIIASKHICNISCNRRLFRYNENFTHKIT